MLEGASVSVGKGRSGIPVFPDVEVDQRIRVQSGEVVVWFVCDGLGQETGEKDDGIDVLHVATVIVARIIAGCAYFGLGPVILALQAYGRWLPCGDDAKPRRVGDGWFGFRCWFAGWIHG